MVGLGDFSKNLKTLSLKRGSVFKMELLPKDGVIPKNEGDKSRNKYFVVLGIDGNKVSVCSTLINTDINQKMFTWIAPYQHKILASDYEFLKGKDRYVDCFSFLEIDYDRILEAAEYKGTIKEEHMEEIIELLKTAPRVKANKLKKYGL